jgi:hypothetical protein
MSRFVRELGIASAPAERRRGKRITSGRGLDTTGDTAALALLYSNAVWCSFTERVGLG